MRQQRELLHQSEEGENLCRPTVCRGKRHSWQRRGGNPSLNVLRAVWDVDMASVFQIKFTTPFQSIRHEQTTFHVDSCSARWADFHRRPECNRPWLVGKPLSWRIVLCKANVMHKRTQRGALEWIWLVSWAHKSPVSNKDLVGIEVHNLHCKTVFKCTSDFGFSEWNPLARSSERCMSEKNQIGLTFFHSEALRRERTFHSDHCGTAKTGV